MVDITTSSTARPLVSGLESDPSSAVDQARAPQFQLPVGACFLIGGSGFSVGIVNHEGQSVGSSRSIPWHEIGVVAGHSLSNEQVIEALFDRLFSVTKDLTSSMSNSHLALLGISFAGPLTGSGDETMAHGTNMGVTFERPIKEYLQTHAQRAGLNHIQLSDIELVNDAVAGALGELYSENGAARGANDLIYLILGTGVGGARIVDGGVDTAFTETGHTLLRGPDGEYSISTMAGLESQGLFENGKFITPTDGRSYLEHRVGGPWVAVRFAKFLVENSDTVLEEISSASRPEGCPEITRNDIEKIAALDEKDVAEWNRLVDKNVERALNIMLNCHAQLSHDITTSEFSQLAFAYENLLSKEIGSALSVLSNTYPDAEIVLGSSLAENRRNNLDFLDALYISTNGKAQISQLESGTQREAASLTNRLQTLLTE